MKTAVSIQLTESLALVEFILLQKSSQHSEAMGTTDSDSIHLPRSLALALVLVSGKFRDSGTVGVPVSNASSAFSGSRLTNVRNKTNQCQRTTISPLPPYEVKGDLDSEQLLDDFGAVCLTITERKPTAEAVGGGQKETIAIE